MGTTIGFILIVLFIVLIETGYLANVILKAFNLMELEDTEDNEKHQVS